MGNVFTKLYTFGYIQNKYCKDADINIVSLLRRLLVFLQLKIKHSIVWNIKFIGLLVQDVIFVIPAKLVVILRLELMHTSKKDLHLYFYE